VAEWCVMREWVGLGVWQADAPLLEVQKRVEAFVKTKLGGGLATDEPAEPIRIINYQEKEIHV
jgi:hypothetical protein